MPAAKFGLWTGIILSLGNCGMILSASPLAWLVDNYGWRGGFWLCAIVSLCIAVAVLAVVQRDPSGASTSRRITHGGLAVFRLGLSRDLRGVDILAFFSIAMVFLSCAAWAAPG